MKLRLLLLLIFFICFGHTQANPIETVLSKEQISGFQENVGQIVDQYNSQRRDIDFMFKSNNINGYVGANKIHYQWQKSNVVSPGDKTQKMPLIQVDFYRIDVSLVGAHAHPEVVTENVLPDVDIYYNNRLDNARARSYKKITYKEVYDNIDWVIYVTDKALKYDFIVRPGGKAEHIKLKYEGAESLNLLDGALMVQGAMGTLKENQPYTYLAESGKMVASAYMLKDNILSFDIAAHQGTLVIDPVLELDWATYYGGAGLEVSHHFPSVSFGAGYMLGTNSVTTDYQDNILMAGTTYSIDNIATTGSFKVSKTLVEGQNAYLIKFDKEGKRLWATYFGGYLGKEYMDYDLYQPYYVGTRSGRGHSIACDAAGNIYMAGNTLSDSGIATPGAHQPKRALRTWPNGLDYYDYSDLFLVKFDADGNRKWGTYVGDEGPEEGGSIAVSADGHVYLAGSSNSGWGQKNILSGSPHIPHSGGNGTIMGFLTRFDSSGKQIWGTYIGNTKYGHTFVFDLTMNNEEEVYVTGNTYGDAGALFGGGAVSIATVGSHQPIRTDGREAFLQKWDSTGNRQWGTYYGGDGFYDLGFGVACDDSGYVYMSGQTESMTGYHGAQTIATLGSHMETYTGVTDAFLVKFNTAGVRQWGTYLGQGNGNDIGYGVVCANQKVYMTGHTNSDSLATPDAYQKKLTQVGWAPSGGYIAQFSNTGILDYLSYYGGNVDLPSENGLASEAGVSIAASKGSKKYHDQSIFFTGVTNSTSGIATTGSYQDKHAVGVWDAFLVKFNTHTSTYLDEKVCEGARFTYNGTTYDKGGEYIHVFKGANGSDSAVKVYLTVIDHIQPTITVDEFILSTAPGSYQTYQWFFNGSLIKDATDSILNVGENGLYTVIVSDTNGCIDTSAEYRVTNDVGIGSPIGHGPNIHIYPNPTESELHIQSPVAVAAILRSLEGKKVLEINNAKIINVNGISKGLYFLSIYDKSGNLLKAQKIVIQ